MQDNDFENVVYKMAAILSRPQCANLPQRNSTKKLYLVKLSTKKSDVHMSCIRHTDEQQCKRFFIEIYRHETVTGDVFAYKLYGNSISPCYRIL